MGFIDDLAAAKEELSGAERPKSDSVPIVVNGVAREVFMFRASGTDWSNATIKHPPRPGSPLEATYGYNLAAVASELLPEYGRVVDGDEEVQLSADQWADLFEVLPGTVKRTVEIQAWAVNERQPQQEIDAAKKALRAVSKKKRS